MLGNIIDGKALAATIREDIKQQVTKLSSNGITPTLAVILVGDDPASALYVKNKIKACAETGIKSVPKQFPASLSENELLEVIAELNADADINGILVQLPLPKHINSLKVIEAISPAKDVDGFHIANAGALMTGNAGFLPCTPYGCMKMLESIDFPLKGKHAVVVGRSNIVGKPIAMMLLQKDATVTICHSATKNLRQLLLQADLVIAAVGKAKFITADMIKPGAVVIDVGINRDENGKLCGDVDFAKMKSRTSYITPVPGGVGPMTITMLLYNTLEAAKKYLNDK